MCKRLRNERIRNLQNPEVAALLNDAVAIINVLDNINPIILLDPLIVRIVSIRRDRKVQQLNLNQPILIVPSIGRNVPGRFFNGELISVGIVCVRGDAGEVFTGEQPIGSIVRVGDDAA